MDSVKADILLKALQGNSVGKWKIEKLKNHGKSAAVFLANDGENQAAVKIFDDELIERYGDKAQLARIDLELTLVGKSHPNMVKILDGGFDKVTSNHFIVMEYLDGPNIKECLADIPIENIGSLIEQLASCAQFLEDERLVHRDIKPENIILLDDYSRLVLLDFGVLRSVGQPGLTDDDGLHPFIGTLQYSSPEFLLREEKDDTDGWRALTFYQIGAVLHDLIMRRELFAEYAVPYARLVNAVQSTAPSIQSSNVESYLVDLARACLITRPEARLQLLNWRSFQPPKLGGNEADSAKQRFTNRVLLKRAERIDPESAPVVSPQQLINEVIDQLKREARSLRVDNDLFPHIDTVFRPSHRDELVVRLNASDDHNLAVELTILIKVQVVEANARAVSLDILGHWGKNSNQPQPEPLNFFKGPIDTGTIRESFENGVYRLLDVAQNIESTIGEEWILIPD